MCYERCLSSITFDDVQHFFRQTKLIRNRVNEREKAQMKENKSTQVKWKTYTFYWISAMDLLFLSSFEAIDIRHLLLNIICLHSASLKSHVKPIFRILFFATSLWEAFHPLMHAYTISWLLLTYTIRFSFFL